MEYLSAERAKALREFLVRAKAETPRVLRLPLNERGRDFCIGDVHGAFDLVWAAMKAAGFDPACDRLLSSGDLVDRGDGSARVTKFLSMPYVEAVPGNHEDALVDLYKDQEDADAIVEVLARMNWNGMRWLGEVSAEARAKAIEEIAQLPLVIEVETARGLVGVIHGEVPQGMSWPTFIQLIEAGDKATMKSCLEGRERIEHNDRRGVPGIGRIFSGHTIRWQGAERRGNIYSIDTGAVFAEHDRNPRGRMTIADIVSKTASLGEPRVVGNVHVHDRPAAMDAASGQPVPFGNYAEAEGEDARPTNRMNS